MNTPLVTYVLEEAEYSSFLKGLVPASKIASEVIATHSLQTEPIPTSSQLFAKSTVTAFTGSSLPNQFNVGSASSGSIIDFDATATTPGIALAELTSIETESSTQQITDLVTFVVDTGATPTIRWISSNTSYSISDTTIPYRTDGPTDEPVAAESTREATPQVLVIVVAIGAVIALFVSIMVLVMFYFQRKSGRNDNYIGAPDTLRRFGKRFCPRALTRAELDPGSRRQTMSSLCSLRQDDKGNGGVSRALPSITPKAPFSPRPQPLPQLNRTSRPKRPERTRSTFINNLSKKHVTWQDQLFDDASFVSLPALTRSVSSHTSFTFGSDKIRSPVVVVDEGTPLPDPPARLAHPPKASHTGRTYSFFPKAFRSSVYTPSQLGRASGCYGVPGTECGMATTPPRPGSPAPATSSNLFRPPASSVKISPSCTHSPQEGPTRLAGLSLLTPDYLRSSQAASSQYNSVIGGCDSDYESVSAYSACYSSDNGVVIVTNPEIAECARVTEEAGKDASGAATSNSPEGPLGSMRSFGKTLSESVSFATASAMSTTLSLLGGNSSFAPSTRKSSVRGSGVVYSSKPNLVSLSGATREPKEAVAVAVAAAVARDLNSIDEKTQARRLSIIVPRTGSYTSFPPPHELKAPARGSSPAPRLANRLSMDNTSRIPSMTESVISVSSTGSSILFRSGADEEVQNPQPHDKTSSRCLTKTTRETTPRTFGPSRSIKTDLLLTAGGFNFPSPWAKDVEPTKHPKSPAFSNCSTLTGSQRLSHTSAMCVPVSPAKPRSTTAPCDPRRDSPNNMYGNTIGMVAESQVVTNTAPTMESLIHELQHQTGNSGNCSSSSTYSSSSKNSNRARSSDVPCANGHSATSSASSASSASSSLYIAALKIPDMEPISNCSTSSSNIANDFIFPFAPTPSPSVSANSASSIDTLSYPVSAPPPPSPTKGIPTLPQLQFHPLLQSRTIFSSPSSLNSSTEVSLTPPAAPRTTTPCTPPFSCSSPGRRPKTRGKHTANRSIALSETRAALENSYSPTLSMVNFYSNGRNSAGTRTRIVSSATATTASPTRKVPVKVMSMLVIPQRISAFFAGRKGSVEEGVSDEKKREEMIQRFQQVGGDGHNIV